MRQMRTAAGTAAAAKIQASTSRVFTSCHAARLSKAPTASTAASCTHAAPRAALKEPEDPRASSDPAVRAPHVGPRYLSKLRMMLRNGGAGLHVSMP